MSMMIDGVGLPRGEKVKGYIDVGEASTHKVRMPYIAVSGVEAGPVLCVLGGVHALEYAGVIGVLEAVNSVRPEDLRGVLLAIPVVNTEGFHARAAFVNPIDYVNQNRVFPGEAGGTMSRRVAAALFKNFISKADALIDSHGGDLTEDINRFVIIGKTEDQSLHDRMVGMASCYNAHYIRVTDIKGSTKDALELYGIPCITPESGTPYPVRGEEIGFHQNGIINVMRYLSMLEGEPEMKSLSVDPEQRRMRAERGGIWRQRVMAGERVEEGKILGEVVDLFGNNLQILVAPFEGVVNNTRTTCVVNSGDTLLYVIKL